MSKYLRKFQVADLLTIEPMTAFAEDKDIVFRIRDNLAQLPESMAVTVVNPAGEAIAVFYALPLYPKVWELCAYVDKSVDQCGLHYSKVTKSLVALLFRATTINRLQLTMRADQPWAGRWATFLGFNFEGRLRKYGAEGVDHFLYAKVRE